MRIGIPYSSKKIFFFIVSLACGLSVLLSHYGMAIYSNSLPFINNHAFKNQTIVYNEINDTVTKKNVASSDLTAQYITNVSTLYSFHEVDCSRLFTGDTNYTQEVIQLVPKFNESVPDEYYINTTNDCEQFRQKRGYIMSSLTDEEKDFPIAFSIIAFKNSEMVERLLRAIYRPQNYYCIHVDLKSPDSFFRSISYIANCFSNVFLTTKRISVTWGELTVLEPELLCMEELLRYKKWRYFINLTGQEFPLKTNFELVRILKAYNGANNIGGTIKNANTDRWENKPPPFGLRPVKGPVHITVNREFVEYMFNNDTALTVVNWSRTIKVPDEALFATLNFNPQLGVRGTYKGDPDNMNDFVTRYKIWNGDASVCAGHSVRLICIQSTGDLSRLGQARHLFANKFYLEEDRVVIGCLEEKLLNNTRDEYLGTTMFNASYYENLDFVKNQII